MHFHTLFVQFVAFCVEHIFDAQEQVVEAGQAMPRCSGKIGAAIKRQHGLRVYKHCQWPTATLLGEQLQTGLIDLIQVRTLFAVDFDAHIICVHHVGCTLVGKRFMGHDVAPMATGVANGQ